MMGNWFRGLNVRPTFSSGRYLSQVRIQGIDFHRPRLVSQDDGSGHNSIKMVWH